MHGLRRIMSSSRSQSNRVVVGSISGTETRAQSGEVTFPRSHSQDKEVPGLSDLIACIIQLPEMTRDDVT